MRLLAALILLFGTLSGPVRAADSPLLVHFQGPETLSQRKDLGGLKQVLGLAESKRVGVFFLNRLARLVRPDFVSNESPEGIARIADLLSRAVPIEFAVEITDLRTRAWRATFRLPAPDQAAWLAALRSFTKEQGSSIKSRIDAEGSWSIHPQGTHRALHVATHGDWVFLDATGESQPSPWRRHARLKHRPLPTNDDLGRVQCDSDTLSLLAPEVTFPHSFALNLELQAHKQRIRTEGSIVFTDAVQPRLAPFDIPTNTVRDPLISFSAARGFRDWLASWKELPQWRLPEVPDQAFAWAHQDVPMHALLAFPFPDAAGYLRRQSARVKEALNPDLAERTLGEIVFDEASGGQVLQGLMLLAPFVAPAPESSGNWAVAGSVVGNRPIGTSTNPPPAALLSQIQNRENLLYYHWEVTQPRLEQLTMLISFIRVVGMRFTTAGEDPFPRWLMSVRPHLGNTVTEISRDTDRRWTLTRTSDLGLTAMELTLLGQRFAPRAKGPALPTIPPVN